MKVTLVTTIICVIIWIVGAVLFERGLTRAPQKNAAAQFFCGVFLMIAVVIAWIVILAMGQ